MPNPIAAENTCPGTTAWRVDHQLGPENAIEAFTTPASVTGGNSVSIYVSTTAASYSFTVYRLGYYQGLGAKLVYSSPTLTGIHQPAPTIDPATRMVSARAWRDPVAIHVPTSWVSGIYVVKLLSSDMFIRYTPFVVRNEASTAPFLFQLPLLTYQAYNRWGDYSLYRGLAPDGTYTQPRRSYAVSFDRPYDGYMGPLNIPSYDLDLITWLEQKAYNVTYAADTDISLQNVKLTRHRVFIVSGHSEYWTTSMRADVTAARDAGVSLAFFGANDIYWHVRLQDSPLGPGRVEVCYKDASLDPLAKTDPAATTVRWRDPPLNYPENGVLGQMYGGEVTGSASLVLDAGAEPFTGGTSLQPGSTFPGLIGGEYDRVYQNAQTPPTLSIVASSPLQCIPTSLCPPSGQDIANATIYTSESGASVFDAGTFSWSAGLSEGQFGTATSVGTNDAQGIQSTFEPSRFTTTFSTPVWATTTNPQFQQFTANILQRLLGAGA
jgi:N,N-dimethylformamidase beta subunit-like, C-terminal